MSFDFDPSTLNVPGGEAERKMEGQGKTETCFQDDSIGPKNSS